MFLYSSYTFFFFFYSYRYHRDLHSFPTRRSSDLSSSHLFLSSKLGKLDRTIVVYLRTFLSKIIELNISRSEEHTSELQSRFDHVCRLLLEKKNKNNFA